MPDWGRVCIATPVDKPTPFLCTNIFLLDVNASSLSRTPQSDCQIHLQPQVGPATMEEYLSTIHMHPQASSQLNKLRIYLSVARLLDYSISDEVTKVTNLLRLLLILYSLRT